MAKSGEVVSEEKENIDKLPWIASCSTFEYPNKKIDKIVPDELKQGLTVKGLCDFLIKQDEHLDAEGKIVISSIENIVSGKTRGNLISVIINQNVIKVQFKDGKLILPEEDVRNYGTIDTIDINNKSCKFYRLALLINSYCI